MGLGRRGGVREARKGGDEDDDVDLSKIFK